MWQSSGTRSEWKDEHLEFEVDVTAPASGLRHLRLNDGSIEQLRPLRISASGEPTGEASRLRESYVRQRDLIATYSEADSEQFLPQIYWRVLPERSGRRMAGVDLVVSVQTQLLDSLAAVRITSDAAEGTTLLCRPQMAQPHLRPETLTTPSGVTTSDAPALLLRPADQDWSYAQLVIPSDLSSHRISPLDTPSRWSRVETSLFAERLEKGVIRRGRMRAVWLPRHDDLRLLAEEFQEFIEAPLPLTT